MIDLEDPSEQDQKKCSNNTNSSAYAFDIQGLIQTSKSAIQKIRKSTHQHKTVMADNGSGDNDFFPDPRPNGNGNGSIYLNDVSRMSSFPNGTPVSKIFFPRCETDVINILQCAHSVKKQVGIRGTKHSMG